MVSSTIADRSASTVMSPWMAARPGSTCDLSELVPTAGGDHHLGAGSGEHGCPAGAEPRGCAREEDDLAAEVEQLARGPNLTSDARHADRAENLGSVIPANRPGTADRCPDPEGAAVVAGQGLVDVQVAVESGLGAGDHRAADAGLADPSSTSPMATIWPHQLSSSHGVAVGIDQHVRSEAAHVPVAGGMQCLPAARLAVVSTWTGMRPRTGPAGMVHSIGGLVSSVGSAKYSADAGGLVVAETRVAGNSDPARRRGVGRRTGP